MNPKAFISILGAILILSGILNTTNWWEYIFLLVDMIAWTTAYILLAIWYLKSIGKAKILKWNNYIYSGILSILISSSLLDVIYQAQSTIIRIKVGEEIRGWHYYCKSAEEIGKIQPLYLGSHYFTILLISVPIFIFITCSGWATKTELKREHKGNNK